MDGEDVMTVFPISHNEKVLELRDIYGKDKDWKPLGAEQLMSQKSTGMIHPFFVACLVIFITFLEREIAIT